MRAVIAVLALLTAAAVYFGGGKLLRSPGVKQRLAPLASAAGDAIKKATDKVREAAGQAGGDAEAEETEPPTAAALFDAIVRDVESLKQKQAEGGLPPLEARKRLHELERRYQEAAERWGGEYAELTGEQSRIAVLEADGQAIDADVKAELTQRLEQGRKAKQAAKERLQRRGAKLSTL